LINYDLLEALDCLLQSKQRESLVDIIIEILTIILESLEVQKNGIESYLKDQIGKLIKMAEISKQNSYVSCTPLWVSSSWRTIA